MFWELLRRRLLSRLMQALRVERRLTHEESYQLLQLSGAIIDYGRMIQAHYECPVPVIVEISELATRFRETLQTMKDALLLIRDMGRAQPADLRGCWKLLLADTLPCGRDGVHSATRHSHSFDDGKDDLGAA